MTVPRTAKETHDLALKRVDNALEIVLKRIRDAAELGMMFAAITSDDEVLVRDARLCDKLVYRLKELGYQVKYMTNTGPVGSGRPALHIRWDEIEE
jgi:hypothetical protein